jgi:molybdopterin-guanine dinucleotide biosynthesis protein A
MIGVVLCGGQSIRMGADKGLMTSGNDTWAYLTAKKLQSLQLPVKFSVNNSQEIAYGALFQNENLISDNQELAIGGPLKGILSAHLAFPDEDLFVLACDMISIESSLMTKLIVAKEQNSDFEAYVFTNAEFFEPLCGIYTANGLASILKVYREGNLKKFSLQFVLNQLYTYPISITDSLLSQFKNFNSPTEI